MFTSKLFLALALAGATGGVRSSVPPGGTVKVRGRSYVRVPALVHLRGLRMTVDERAGIYTLKGGGHRVALVPGFSVADVDGRIVNLSSPAVFYGDELVIPRELYSRAWGGSTAPVGNAIPLGRVVIDAGHGGRDSGAMGRGGLMEKDVALSVALRLKRLLEARGVRVVMTRSGDRFIPLMERSRIANRARADLFLSIHCNATTSRSVSGLESFALSWGISDSYRAGKAAGRHRPSELIAGAADRVSPGTERAVLRAHMGEQRRRSHVLARAVQGEMVRRLGEPNRGVKLRNFSVLRETYIPAALAEVGFISYPATERRMRSPAYRQRIAVALAEGVARYARSERLRLDRIAGRAPAAPLAELSRPAARPRSRVASRRRPTRRRPRRVASRSRRRKSSRSRIAYRTRKKRR